MTLTRVQVTLLSSAPVERWDAAGPGDATTVDWRLAAVALADEVARVTALLRSVDNPDTPALGRWNVAEVAMHLSQVWIAVPGLASDDRSPVYELLPALESTAGASLIPDLWDLEEVTMAAVEADPERRLPVLADRIDERAREFLGGLNDNAARVRHAWLVQGVTVTTTTLLCHLLSETIVHGGDIARTAGRKWSIPRAHAVLALDGFFFPVVSALPGRALVDPEAAEGLRATYELQVRGGGSYLFTFDDGSLRIERPGSGRVDCHISADPVALLLVAWSRRGQWPAIGRGQIVAWGRKPWLGPRFRSLLRNP